MSYFFRHFVWFFLFLVCAHAEAQEYVLVWNDEFNMAGLPDTTKWNYRKGRTGVEELQYYTVKRPQNARIEDSVLILELRKEKYGDADYTSACLMSNGIGDWRYGKIEISAKVPDGKGTWPALWMMPVFSKYGPWPKSGEIDIMEYIAVEPDNLYYTCHFEGTDGSGHQHAGSGPVSDIKKPFQKFIKFTLVWTPDKLAWYADDVKYFEYARPNNTTDPRLWPFDKKFYLILNLAYGGWGGYNGVDDSALPQRFLIDYVRVYQLRETQEPFSLDVPDSKGGIVMVDPPEEEYPSGTEVILTAVPDEGYVFRMWEHWSRANPFVLQINKNTMIRPLFIRKNECLINGTFDTGWDYWVKYVYNDSLNVLTLDVKDSMLIADVTSETNTQEWYAGFQQTGFAMDSGIYTLRFDARASQQETLFIAVAKNYYDWMPYVYTYKPLDTVLTNYVIPFQFPVADESVRLFFGVGKSNGKIWFDNISLMKETPSSVRGAYTPMGTFEVYPNPASEKIIVDLKGKSLDSPVIIQIYNMHGQLMLEKKTNKTREIMDISLLTSGTYLVSVKCRNFFDIKKIIKRTR